MDEEIKEQPLDEEELEEFEEFEEEEFDIEEDLGDYEEEEEALV